MNLRKKISVLVKDKEILIDVFFFFIFISFFCIGSISLYTNLAYWKDIVDTITFFCNLGAMLIIMISVAVYFSRFKQYYRYVFIFPFTIYLFVLFLLSTYENVPVRLSLLLVILCFTFTKAKIRTKVFFILSIFLLHLIIAYLQNKSILIKCEDHVQNNIYKETLTTFTNNVIVLGIILFIYLYKEYITIRKNEKSRNDSIMTDDLISLLTAKEKEILTQLFEAKTYSEIAVEICRSKRTVEAHAGNIYKKLAVKNRRELLTKYRK